MSSRSIVRPVLAAAAAVLAVVAVAACGGSSNKTTSAASGGSNGQTTSGGGATSGKGKPTIVLGDKNFTEEFILGYLYKDALEAKGFTVKLKPNIGSSELVNKSLTSHKIDMYPEYTGVIDTVLAGVSESNPPKTAAQAYAIAKKYENKHGFAVLKPTPFQDADAIAVKPAYAKAHHLTTISDFAKLKHWTYGGPEENKTRYEGVVGLEKAYGLHNFTFVGLQEGQAYPALDAGKIDAAAVFTTDGQLAQKGKYAIVKDSKGIFGFQQVTPVIRKSLLAKEGPAFTKTLNAVDALLTDHVMSQLNGAVDLDKQDPNAVAKKFLQANHLA